MELLIAVFIMIFFCLGYFFGLVTPILIRRFFEINGKNQEEIDNLNKEISNLKKEIITLKVDTPTNPKIDSDVLNEWFTGQGGEEDE